MRFVALLNQARITPQRSLTLWKLNQSEEVAQSMLLGYMPDP